MVIFFFFFYETLYNIRDIQLAFKKICFEKMLSDGYFDMSEYIYGRIKKDDMYAQLMASDSKYAALYRGSYPKKENAVTIWRGKIEECSNENIVREFTYLESRAIVNWVYRMLKNAKERTDFTVDLFKKIKDFHHIKNNIECSRGVVYNRSKVELQFFSSVSGVEKFVSSLKKKSRTLFFRGHSDPNFLLRPSVMRTSQWEQNESAMYHELLINCPDDFEKYHTHLEKLVKMQHYGLPTRLLDITRNLLVALYFACESRVDNYGELVLISAENSNIKYPQSDTVSILASLPVFSYQKQRALYNCAKDPNGSNLAFNSQAEQLIHEVRLEKPAFQAGINRDDILNNYIVYALKNNNRIVKQDGAFIICGLAAGTGSLENFRYEEHGKKIIILIDQKERILKQLENFSISRATLFPEIECVAECIKNKYEK